MIRYFIIFIIPLFLFQCNFEKSRIAKSGVIEFSDYKDSKFSPKRLDGQWKFYWNQFIDPNKIENVYTNDFISIPGVWNQLLLSNGEKISNGY
ncbi:MAG: hypothetical protein SFU98_18740 [Leptospiraceae bacterium]|nr:hypothetical protein [Leptospiraceae bacterium]